MTMAAGSCISITELDGMGNKNVMRAGIPGYLPTYLPYPSISLQRAGTQRSASIIGSFEDLRPLASDQCG
jgi:hypothetical protein